MVWAPGGADSGWDLGAFTCVNVGELPLGIEGDRWPGATPAAGEAAAREGQEARGLELELEHSGGGAMPSIERG